MPAIAEDLCTTPATQRCLAVLRDLSGDVNGPMERHSIRVVLLAEELARQGGHTLDSELVLCAGLLHDLGLYPGAASKAAYVTDSRRLAETILTEEGWPAERVELAAEAVERHHELPQQWSRGTEVELLRRADLIEVSHGLVSFGVTREFRTDLLQRIPRDGFVGEVLRGLGRALRERPATLWRIVKPG
ncbi:MAG: Metal dependent phosphohydrolase [Solirubrobacterales bacterium]|nr:Metal dependent phosphohydrolase [Solirubrobacterales bacterium]